MKHQTLALGSVVAVSVIAIVICVGMVSGYSVFKQYISVDPVSDRNAGDVFTVTGTTNLPVGTELMGAGIVFVIRKNVNVSSSRDTRE